jgi:hypothetical protein
LPPLLPPSEDCVERKFAHTQVCLTNNNSTRLPESLLQKSIFRSNIPSSKWPGSSLHFVTIDIFYCCGIPCKGPLFTPFISASIVLAIASFRIYFYNRCNSSPFLSIASIRFRYNCTNCSEVYLPEDNFSRKLLIVSSSSSNATSATTSDPSFLLR